MGIMTAVDIFQQEMSMLFHDMPFVKMCLDEILIVSCNNVTDHLDKLAQVSQRLLEENLKVKMQKHEFLQKKVECLGFNISNEGIYSIKDKINGIINLSPPTNRKQLKRFLGMFNHYECLCKTTDVNLETLHDLTSPNKTF